MDARLLHRPRPRDVGLLVEAGLQLDDGDDLLVGLDGTDQRFHDRAVTGGAVERLLYGEDARVERRLLDERLDRRGERVVGMVDDDIGVTEHRKDVDVGLARGRQPGLGHGEPWIGLQVGPVELVHRPQAAEVERPVDRVHVVLADLELAHEELAHLGGHVGGYLEPHGAPAPPRPQLELHRGEQVVGLLVPQRGVGVTSDPEREVGFDLHAGEQHVEMRGDHLLEGDEALAVGHDDEAWEKSGDLHAREPAVAAGRVAHHHREVQREVGDVRERVPRVDTERREHREDALVEHAHHVLAVVVVERFPVGHPDPDVGEGGHDPVEEDPRLALGELVDARPDGGQLLARGEAVRRAHAEAGRDLVLQASNAHPEELVEVLAGDGEELGPLEQRHPVVGREGEDARVEVEPRELAVEEARLAAGDGRERRTHRATAFGGRPAERGALLIGSLACGSLTVRPSRR